MNQLSAMRAFIRLVESGSFTRAARTLSIPKSTVSNLIQGLETHLQTKLINRTTRRVLITSEGALYYERSLRIISEIDELDNNLSSAQKNPVGYIRVEMAGALLTSIVAVALPSFYDKFPGIRVDLGVSDGNIDYIAENVDCALRVGYPSDQSLRARRVGGLQMITCAAPLYFEKFGFPQRPEDLRVGHQAVGYFRSHTNQTLPFTFARDGRKVKMRLDYSLSVNDGRALLDALKAGLGVGQIPRVVAQEAIGKGELVTTLQEWTCDALPIFVVYPQNRHLSNKVRVFVDWLVKLLTTSKLL